MKKTQNNGQPRKKKHLGQHFLHKQSVVDNMIDRVTITPDTTIAEIGCGDGFLTRAILEQTKCKKLQVIEFDPEWAQVTKNKIDDPRLHINVADVLQFDFDQLYSEKPLVLLANLPYQITFPLFHKFCEHADLFEQAVVMIQEEPAQKMVAKRGKSYGWLSMYLQYYFDFELMEKVEPGAFSPPPKVFSRLIHFTRRTNSPQIPNVEGFWGFIKACFKTPRQKLRNNLKRTPFDMNRIPEEMLDLRAQQITLEQFIELWENL